jgi:hypothetical protein
VPVARNSAKWHQVRPGAGRSGHPGVPHCRVTDASSPTQWEG